MASPPPHVLSALHGQRPDFVLPAATPGATPARIRLLAGAAAIASTLFASWMFSFGPGTPTVSTPEGTSRALGETETLLLGAAVLLIGLLVSAFFLSTGLRALREKDAWLAATPEGILVVRADGGARLEPWSGFSEVRRNGADLHLVARPGFRDPGGRNIHAPEDPERIRQACLARMAGQAPPP